MIQVLQTKLYFFIEVQILQKLYNIIILIHFLFKQKYNIKMFNDYFKIFVWTTKINNCNALHLHSFNLKKKFYSIQILLF